MNSRLSGVLTLLHVLVQQVHYFFKEFFYYTMSIRVLYEGHPERPAKFGLSEFYFILRDFGVTEVKILNATINCLGDYSFFGVLFICFEVGGKLLY